jgi:glycosyltransferase involved in cell wall biosynthesis
MRWARRGHEVTVITGAPNAPSGKLYDGYKNSAYQRERIDGIDVIRVWTYLAANRGTWRRTANYVSYLVSAVLASTRAHGVDVVISTSPQFFCGWAGAIASRILRVPFILEVRDVWPDSIEAVGAMRDGRLLRFLYRLEHWLYAAASHIVTVGEGYRDVLIRKGLAPQDLSVITTGIDIERFSPRRPDEELGQLYGLDGRFVCAYVGTIGMASGLDVVLRSARRFRASGCDDVVFLLVGDGAVREDLERRAREQHLTNVVFTGRQDKCLIPRYISVADACLVHLKKTDLFKIVLPSKIFESAAMAKPIILGVEGYAATMVSRAGAGLCIEPENDEQLAEAIDRLAQNTKLRNRLGRSGHAYFTARYNRDELAAEYLQIIDRVLHGSDIGLTDSESITVEPSGIT